MNNALISLLRKHRNEITEWLCFSAIMLLPWQGRWILNYYELLGQRYEYGVISVYGASVVALAAAVLLWLRHRPLRINAFPTQLLIVWLIVSTIASGDRILALYYVVTALLAFSYFLVAALWDREKIIISLILAALMQTLIAWQQFLTQKINASTILGLAEHLPQVLGQSVVIIHNQRFLRAYGLLPHPNMLGGFLLIGFAAAAYHLVMSHTRIDVREVRRGQIISWISLLFTFSGILVTFSRAAILAASLLIILWLIYAWLRHEESMVRLAQRVGLACLALLIIVNGFVGNALFDRFAILPVSQGTEAVRLESISTEQRISSYYESTALFSLRAIFLGYGLGNYLPRLVQAFPSLPIYDYQPVHAVYVLMVLEIGLVGCIFLLWFIVSLFKDRWKRMSALASTPLIHAEYEGLIFSFLLALLFVGLFDHYLWTSFFGQALWWTTVGLAANYNK